MLISFIKICSYIFENAEVGEKMPAEVLIWPYVVSLWPWPLTFSR